MAQLKELEELSVFLADFVTKLDAALADGKITFVEAFNAAWELVPEIRAAFTGLNLVPAEIKSATTDDLNQLAVRVGERLSLRDNHAKSIAIKAINMAICAVDLVNVIKEKPELVRGLGAAGDLVIPSLISINEEGDAIL